MGGKGMIRLMQRLVGAARDAWLMLGIAVVLLLGFEVAYRAQGALRRWATGSGGDLVLFDHRPPWMDAYMKEWNRSNVMRWEPYVYYRRRPFRGVYINVDSAGRRITPQMDLGPTPRQVFFFGGSTMWGSNQRDSATIPARVSSALREQGVGDVRVTNFGESGYILTQEVLELLLQLRSGARPAVVVFYDGINDAFTTVQRGRPGLPQNEFSRERDFALGRRVFNGSHDLGAELGAMGAVMRVMGGRVLFVNRLRRLIMRPAQRRYRSADSLSTSLVRSYRATAELVGALARAYGFSALLLWQPNLHATTKVLSPSERRLMSAVRASRVQSLVQAVQRRIPAQLDTAMTHVQGVTFLDISTVFTADSQQVYVDEIGHTDEAANVPIVNAILPSLSLMLGQHPVGGAGPH